MTDPYGAGQSLPTGGYTVPAPPPVAGDPLVSTDFAGWAARSTALVRQAWRPLARLQLVGFGVMLAVQVPVFAYATVRSAELTAPLRSPSARRPAPDCPFSLRQMA